MNKQKLFEIAGIEQVSYDKLIDRAEHVEDRVGWALDQLRKRENGNRTIAKRQLALAKNTLDILLKELGE